MTEECDHIFDLLLSFKIRKTTNDDVRVVDVFTDHLSIHRLFINELRT